MDPRVHFLLGSIFFLTPALYIRLNEVRLGEVLLCEVLLGEVLLSLSLSLSLSLYIYIYIYIYRCNAQCGVLSQHWHLMVAGGLLKHTPVSGIQNPVNTQTNISIHLDVDNK